ncbi:MAG: ABC transporter permease [Cytophagaceae bacterium]
MWNIIRREVSTRVQKKSFWVLTLVGPVVMLVTLVVPMYISMQPKSKIQVVIQVKEQGELTAPVSDERFHVVLGGEQQSLSGDAILVQASLSQKQLTVLDNVGLTKQESWYLEQYLQQWFWKTYLFQRVPPSSIQPNIEVVSLAKTRESFDIQSMLGLYGAILIYFFIVFYGVQVMRGVMEEKSGRIAEVLLSSVEPFQWMMGKIIGIGAVCLFQFSIWGTFYGFMWTNVQKRYGQTMNLFSDANIGNTLEWTQDVQQALEWNMMVQSLQSISMLQFVLGFFLFFILGYLLYASMFAAVGAMTDQETETQQFTFPITAPLFVVFLFAGSLMSDTNSMVTQLLSYIPFTAPITMVMRLPFGLDWIEWIGAVVSLVISFTALTYVASMIFKRSILHYGSTMKWSDLWK